MTVGAGFIRIAKELNTYHVLGKLNYDWDSFVNHVMFKYFGVFHGPRFLNNFLENKKANEILPNIEGKTITVVTSGVKQIEIDFIAVGYDLNSNTVLCNSGKYNSWIPIDRIVAIDGERVDFLNSWTFKGNLTKLIETYRFK